MALFKKRPPIKIISILDGDDPLGEYLRRRYRRDAFSAWRKDFYSRVMGLKPHWSIPPFEGLIGHGDEFPIQLVGK